MVIDVSKWTRHYGSKLKLPTENTVQIHRYEQREDYAYAHRHLGFSSTRAATKIDLLDP